jgi:hypothetical protein
MVKELIVKITYDPKVDALSIIFRETTATTKHLAEASLPITMPRAGWLVSRFSMPSNVSGTPRRSAMLFSKASAPRPLGSKRCVSLSSASIITTIRPA